MSSRKISSESGFTLVELMIAGGVFAVGMVIVSGSVISAHNHNQMTMQRAAAADFNDNALENLRGMDIADILTFGFPADDPNTGAVNIPGVGMAQVEFYAVIPGVGSLPPRYFHIGVDSPTTLATIPNPIEIQMVMANDAYSSYPNHESFKASTMIFH